MKIRMNLLPYREARRRETRQRFWVAFGLAFASSLVVVGAVHVVIAGYISNQEARNAYIKSQNLVLDERIKEIASLRENIDAVKAQQDIIGELQGDRTAPANLLDQMVRIVPDGMYLSTLTQKGNEVVVAGLSQSSDLVSSFMVSIQGSPFLHKPELIEIKAVYAKDNRRFQQFSLKFSIRPAKTEVTAGIDAAGKTLSPVKPTSAAASATAGK